MKNAPKLKEIDIDFDAYGIDIGVITEELHLLFLHKSLEIIEMQIEGLLTFEAFCDVFESVFGQHDSNKIQRKRFDVTIDFNLLGDKAQKINAIQNNLDKLHNALQTKDIKFAIFFLNSGEEFNQNDIVDMAEKYGPEIRITL